MGLEPPASLAMTDEDANEWIRVNGTKYQWVHSVRNYRRINALKRKLESFDFATLSDDRYYGGIMYFGAHTGRFSGSGGNLNIYGGGGDSHHGRSSVGGGGFWGGAVAGGHPQGGNFSHNHESHSSPGSGGSGGYFNSHRGSNGRPGLVVVTHFK